MRRRTFAGPLCAVCAVLLVATWVVVPTVAGPVSAASGGSGGLNRPEHRGKPYVVLVSLDGFKPEYPERFQLPHLQRLVRTGARAGALIPVFPTLTFPNHYSLATGLYPERHGIVSNSFYDPRTRKRYALRDRGAVGDATWYRGEPIWVTAETQGMVSACFFWPGSEAAIGGVRPTFWKRYDEGIPNDDRVRAVVEWLRLPVERRPHIITLYFSELDSASHDGPLDAPAIARAARSLDRSVGTLLEGVAALPIRDRVYVLLTSDHGMVELTPSQELSLGSFVDTSQIETAYGGPVANLHVRPHRATHVRDELNARLKHGRAYLREELPERFHYRADPRAGDVVVVMDESWTLNTGLHRLVRPFLGRRGMHGWDPALRSMHALFVASGPDVRGGATIPEIHMVDLYPFMTELLGLRPAANVDGRGGVVREQIIASDPVTRY
jgi:predicted AlkP superfamily pyrophosphatase or phosphodiesterase